MSKTSRNGFVHSIKVPRIYKTASTIFKKVVEEGGSLKDLVYGSGHKNFKGIYALVVKAIQRDRELDKLLKCSKILKNETGLQPWLAKILVTELFLGKKELKGNSKPVQTVLSYKEKFEKVMRTQSILKKETNLLVTKPRYVRVNTLHQTPDEIIKVFRNEGWSFISPPSDYSDFLNLVANLKKSSFTKDFHLKEILVFPGNTHFYDHELYKNGSILLQDKASCLPAFLLKPAQHSVALDMCAAPGMKTTHLCALMKNKGKIYAVEMNPVRHKALCNVIQNSGCTNVTLINSDALLLSANSNNENIEMSWCKDVEYILVDPSCSGSGITDRLNIFKNERQNFKRLKRLCGFQFKLLMHALTNFPKVKRVVYSTCSVLTKENEEVVEKVLRKLTELYENERNEKIPRFQLIEPLKDTWMRRGSDNFPHGKFCLFSDPKKDLTNGFFIAVFERMQEITDGLSSAVGGKNR